MLDKLYTNIGKKIQTWAKWIFIVEAIGAIIAGFVLIAEDVHLILVALLTVILGPIAAWVSSWLMYGFGKLIEDVEAIRNKDPKPVVIQQVAPSQSAANTSTATTPASAKTTPVHTETSQPAIAPNQIFDSHWVCGKCKTKNLNTRNDCWSCGHKRSTES